MGTKERTETICDSFNLSGWKRSIGQRVLNGCGNCELRYACLSKILDGRDFHVGTLRQALNILTSAKSPVSTHEDVSWLARDLASVGKGQCRHCDALGLCLANAHYAAWASPITETALKKQVQRVVMNMDDTDWPQRVQDVLDLAGCGNTVIIKRAIGCFMSCQRQKQGRRC